MEDGRGGGEETHSRSVVGTTSRSKDVVIAIRRIGVNKAVGRPPAALRNKRQGHRLVADLGNVSQFEIKESIPKKKKVSQSKHEERRKIKERGIKDKERRKLEETTLVPAHNSAVPQS
jgi:hypothetical protein